MMKFLLKRLGIALLLLYAVSTIVFILIHIMPGDPVLLMLGTDSSPDPAAVESLRRELGLDKPIPVQYMDYLKNLLTGDFGISYSEKIPVLKAIGSRLPRTLELALAALLIACIIGIPLGILAALRRGKLSDFFMTVLASFGTSVPVYILGYFFVMIFALDVFHFNLFKFPASGYVDFAKDPAKHFLRLVLPAMTLALGVASSIMRVTRASMLEAMSGESIRPLRAKGLSNRKVILKHVIRNAMIPVVTIIGLQLGNLIGGTVLCETVFNWPGIATLLVKAINHRDYPLIQGCVLVVASIYILTNMLVDIIYTVLDPRMR